MNHHFASIIVPTYNRSFALDRAIRSLLNQTHSDFEAIIVDDASQDNTREVVQAFEDTRLHYCRLAMNRGAQAARNAGIRRARAEWIAFLDSDDEWLPDSLERRLNHARETGARVVHSECLVKHEGESTPRPMGVVMRHGSVYSAMLRSPGPVFPSLLVAREALARIGHLDEDICAYQEWDTALRLAKHYEFAFVCEPTFVWHSDQRYRISHDRLNSARGYEQVFTKHRAEILRRLGPRGLAHHRFIIGLLYNRAGKPGKAAHSFLIATFCWPFKAFEILKSRPQRRDWLDG